MEKEKETCSICLKDLYFGNANTLKTKCNHSFHTNCFLKSLENNNKCPICRKKIKKNSKKKFLTREKVV